MAASAYRMFGSAKEFLGDGTIDLDGHVFKEILLSSVYTPNLDTQNAYADISANELATANGYTAGGATLGSVTWTLSTGTVTFDSADVVWTASGGSIAARYSAIYDDTTTTPEIDALLAYCLLDTTPADVTATDGNTLTIQKNASGMFTLSGMTA